MEKSNHWSKCGPDSRLCCSNVSASIQIFLLKRAIGKTWWNNQRFASVPLVFLRTWSTKIVTNQSPDRDLTCLQILRCNHFSEKGSESFGVMTFTSRNAFLGERKAPPS
ncbi:hypothetical protein XENORESO_019583 [Xenotaenia resolanae]|uniref:Uncharacterized protein n=1 Tax=Xenotaenia resolanae TaxID=208358 RepID=A0ABV0WPI5_9TELE